MSRFQIPLRLPAHAQSGVHVGAVCVLTAAAVWAFGSTGVGVA